MDDALGDHGEAWVALASIRTKLEGVHNFRVPEVLADIDRLLDLLEHEYVHVSYIDRSDRRLMAGVSWFLVALGAAAGWGGGVAFGWWVL